MTRRSSACLAALLAAVMSLSGAPSARAAEPAPPLPAAWIVDGDELVWTSPVPLRMGGARYEIRSGGRLLGYPDQQGDTLRLPLNAPVSLTDLSVWAAGRRLDGPVPRRSSMAPPSGAAVPVAATDPAVPGPYRSQRLRYDLRPLTIDGFDLPLEVVAEVTAPVGTSGPLPIVLVLHGRHSTCYRGGPSGRASGDWPCPPGWQPVPSHTGYRYLTDVLASQGYVTVSISANSINSQDAFAFDAGASARSQLVRHHLKLWARWTTVGGDPWGGRFRGQVDLSRLVLVGHSRGGEGVERATVDTDEADPWQIQGLVLIAPTAFGRQTAPGVHTTVLLPFCDGDVSSLEGQQFIDLGRDLTADRALRTSVMAMGANHNYFNTEWTPGLSRSPAWDDWYDQSDRQCGDLNARRLTPTEQQRVGLAYSAALVHLAAADDLSALPLLDGTLLKPPSIGRATTHVHAIGGAKEILYAPGRQIPVTANGLGATECRGYHLAGPFDLRAECTPDLYFEVLPHWIPMEFGQSAPPPRALAVQWSRAGGSVRIPVTRSLAGVRALDLRIAGEPGAAPLEATVRVRDAAGARADLEVRPVALGAYRGPSPLGKVAARQLRASLTGAAVDLSRVTSVELIPRTPSGRVFLLDVSAVRRGLPTSDQIHLPRISAGDLVVTEGDVGEVTVEVPLTIEGAVTQRATVWVQLTDYIDLQAPIRGFPVVLEPGATSGSVPITYQADDLYNTFTQLTQITLVGVKNAVTGDYQGSLVVEEDDPAPRLTVDASDITTAEGSALRWTFRLSEPMAGDASWPIFTVAPGGAIAELHTDDLPPSFWDNLGIMAPDPPVPLSQVQDYVLFFISIESGQLETTLTIPIGDDGQPEPEEAVALALGGDDVIIPVRLDLTGRVPAH